MNINKAVGVFGGTFDPIHIGHLITAQAVYELRNLSKIFFIPCNISPHKQHLNSADSQHRLEMIKLAIEPVPHFEFSDFEIKEGNISYTFNTLKYLNRFYNKLELIIGFDNLIEFDNWYEPDKILQIAKVIVMKRNHERIVSKIHKYYGLVNFVDTPTIEISSSEIRERIKQNLPIDFLVPEKVKNYIIKNNLYK